MEKKHESLCSSEEMSIAINQKKYYRIPCDLRNINYDIHQYKNTIERSNPYTSKNTNQLNVDQIIKLIRKQLKK